MCIFLERWYVCAHDAEAMPLAPAQANPLPPRDPSKPWESWARGDAVPGSAHEADNPFVRVRHEIVSVLRCASHSTLVYCHTPRATRIELYDSACPHCTGLDGFTGVAQPYATINVGQDKGALTPHELEALDFAVIQYFNQLEDFVCWLTTQLCDDAVLTRDQFRVLFVSRLCKEDLDAEHLGSGNIPAMCVCPNVVMPWASNIARAMQRIDADATYRYAGHDAVVAMRDALEEKNVYHHYKLLNDTPLEQVWLAFENPAVRISLEERVRTAVNELHDRAAFDHPDEHLDWALKVNVRGFVAQMWTYYMALDSGLNPLVCERIFELCVKPFLQADSDRQLSTAYGNGPMANDYLTTGAAELRLMAVWSLHPARFENAFQRRRVTHDHMMIYRATVQRNAIRSQYTMQHHLSFWTISPAEALAVSDICYICQQEFRDYDQDIIPPYLKIAKTPCCGRPLHHSCILSLVRQVKLSESCKCPNCRKHFKDHGWEVAGIAEGTAPVPFGFVSDPVAVLGYEVLE